MTVGTLLAVPGRCFAASLRPPAPAGFTLRNTVGLVRETTMWNALGRAAVLYAVGDDGDLHGFLFARGTAV